MDESPAQRIGNWYRGLNPWVADSAIAFAFVIVGLVTTSGRGTIPIEDFRERDALSVFLVLAATAPLVLRRRAPLLVLIVTATAIVFLSGLGYYEGITPFIVMFAAGSLAVVGSPAHTVIGVVVVFVELIALYFLSIPPFDTGTLVTNLAIFGSVFLVGIAIRSRRERIVALEDRAEAIEHEREEEARRAVADERLRIARELHDVVAHSMGVIAVQAGVGEHVIESDPVEAKRALRAIADVSRSTLSEIRHMLGVLRDDHDAGASYTPAPGLDELDRLARELERAGVPVTVSLEGDRRELPRGLDLTAYRIVQEALTNVLKHAGPTRASVTVRYEPGVLGLRVVDDGRGVNGRSPGGGHGLVGMRERVAVYGGTLASGPRAGGGFEVVARLPYEEIA